MLVFSSFIFERFHSPGEELKYFTWREHHFGYLQDIINDVQLTMSACVWRKEKEEEGKRGKRNYSHYTVIWEEAAPKHSPDTNTEPTEEQRQTWHDGRFIQLQPLQTSLLNLKQSVLQWRDTAASQTYTENTQVSPDVGVFCNFNIQKVKTKKTEAKLLQVHIKLGLYDGCDNVTVNF